MDVVVLPKTEPHMPLTYYYFDSSTNQSSACHWQPLLLRDDDSNTKNSQVNPTQLDNKMQKGKSQKVTNYTGITDVDGRSYFLSIFQKMNLKSQSIKLQYNRLIT